MKRRHVAGETSYKKHFHFFFHRNHCLPLVKTMANTITASFAGLPGPSVRVNYDESTKVEQLSKNVAEALGITAERPFILEDKDGNPIDHTRQLFSLKDVYLVVDKEIILINPDTSAQIIKRRNLYLRPFLLYTLMSGATELVLFLISIVVFSGLHDVHIKFVWTMVFCTIGMGSTMGSLTNYFITDRYSGSTAVWMSAFLSSIVLSACNFLCFILANHFDYFGAVDHPWYFHLRYPLIFLGGYQNGKLLYTEAGFRKLTRLGI